MTKDEAITLFHGVPKLAKALGISRQAIYQWPDDLPQPVIDRVMGAAYRIGLICAAEDRDRTTADAREPTDAGKPIPDSTAGGDDPTGREAA